MRYFLDTEFVERPCTIDLISLGLVAEDGRELYCENVDALVEQANEFVQTSVLPHTLTWGQQWPSPNPNTGKEATLLRGSLDEIAKEVRHFVSDDPEFWAYYADYDWVVFCWLFGSMADLPNGWPMYCRDVKQWCVDLGNPTLPEQVNEHQALEDARWTEGAHGFLQNFAAQAKTVEVDAIRAAVRRDVL